MSECGEYAVENGVPLNPAGRTGVAGRGLLPRFGPNHTACTVVTRWTDADDGTIPVAGQARNFDILLERQSDGAWSLPSTEEAVQAGDPIPLVVNTIQEVVDSDVTANDEKATLKMKIAKTWCEGFNIRHPIARGW